MTAVVEYGDPRDPAATALLQSSHALMQELFPADSNHYLSIDALCEPNIRFFVARVDGKIQGCGALTIKETYGEIKSMFTSQEARGQGLAAKILSKIEAEARAQNLTHIYLETGNLLQSAHRLYDRHGFERCGPFGDYIDDPSSLFMKKRL